MTSYADIRTEMPFIKHSQVVEVAHRLNRSISTSSIILLSGALGSGKSRILRHWLLEMPKAIDPSQIMLINLIESTSRTFGKTRLASPATLIGFSRLWYVCQQLAMQRERGYRALIDQKLAPLYTDPKFLDLLNKIQLAIETLQTRVLIFDNAQYLDISLLQQIISLRESSSEPFAVVFCSRIEDAATTDARLAQQFRAVRGAPQLVTDSYVLALLKDDEFYSSTIPLIFFGLNATISAQVEREYEAVALELWNRAQGNWYNINQLTMLFDQELGDSRNGLRLVTLDVVKTVCARFDNIHRLLLS